MAIRPSTRNASISASGLPKAKTFHLAALQPFIWPNHSLSFGRGRANVVGFGEGLFAVPIHALWEGNGRLV